MDNLTRLLNLSERLEVWRVPGGEIAVAFQSCEVKDGYFLISEFGTGSTFNEAVDDYLEKISGKRLVFNACSENRHEVLVL
jgi:hypothetical protein